MTVLDGIQAVVFDAYGTLFDVHSPAGRLADRLGAKGKALSATWRQKQLEYTWLRSLMGRHADFWQVTGEALDFALEDTGIDQPGLRDDLMREYRQLQAYDDATRMLELLRREGRQTAILSNGSPDMLRAATDHAGLGVHLDAVLSIEAAGIYKPHPRSYQVAVDALGHAPEVTCFVSTNAWDVAGAAAFGFRVVWLNRFGKTPERLPAGPEAVIDTLDDLPPLMAA